LGSALCFVRFDDAVTVGVDAFQNSGAKITAAATVSTTPATVSTAPATVTTALSGYRQCHQRYKGYR